MILICRLDVVQSSFESAGVQFLGSFLENRGVKNKTEEHLAKLEELVIFLFKWSVIILTLPDIIAHTYDCKSVLNIQSFWSAVLLICSKHIVTAEPCIPRKWKSLTLFTQWVSFCALEFRIIPVLLNFCSCYFSANLHRPLSSWFFWSFLPSCISFSVT